MHYSYLGNSSIPESVYWLGAAFAVSVAIFSNPQRRIPKYTPADELARSVAPDANEPRGDSPQTIAWTNGHAISPALAKAFADDPGFSEERFLAFAETLFVLLRTSPPDAMARTLRAITTEEFQAAYAASPVLKNNLRLANGSQFRIERASIAAYRTAGDCAYLETHFDVREKTRRAFTITFARSIAARTPVDAQLAARTCRTCGAPVQLDAFFHCASCGTDVEPGNSDWRIAEIRKADYNTNPVTGYGAAPMAGALSAFAAIEAGDPAFSPDVLRNRVRLLFFNILNAENSGDDTMARANMSTPLYLAWRAENQLRLRGAAPIIRRAVQLYSAEAVGVQHGTYLDGVQYLVDGRETAPQNREFIELWSLQRASGVPTVERGIAEQCCPHCGAEISVNEIGACRFCNVTIVNGEFDWVVVRISDLGEPAAPRTGSEWILPEEYRHLR